MAGRRVCYLMVLTVSFVFYLAYQEWFSWLALITVLCLPPFSLVVSLAAMLRFRTGVVCPDAVPMGMPAEGKLVGWSDLPAPPFGGKLRVSHTLTGEQWQQNSGMALPTQHCGSLTVTPEKVWIYDYLGLFRIRGRQFQSRVVLVRPRAVDIRRLPDLEKYLARAWKPKPGGGYGENHEMREYRPGDSLNQIHWKLTAKTGKLTLREPMEPLRGRVLLTVDICGTPQELDRKLGRLLWLGTHLLEKGLSFDVMALTGEGVMTLSVINEQTLEEALDQLLCATPAASGSVLDGTLSASWHRHVGGEPDEA